MTAGLPYLTPETVLDVMDKHDISEALVINNASRVVYPRSRGNHRLLSWTRGQERLHPVWALEPPANPDPACSRAIVEEMVGEGVRVARLMMGVAPPYLWLWESLCDALVAHRIVCLLDFVDTRVQTNVSTKSNPTDEAVNGLREICLAYPELPMVLSHVSGGLGIAYPILSLLHRVPNLHLDVTSIVDYWRRVAKDLGPARVFFATGMPFYDPAIFLSGVQYASDLSVKDKHLICGGNLRRLLGEVR
jgi:hypothetical protein